MNIDQIIELLLSKRGLTSSADIQSFFNPPNPMEIPLEDTGLSAENCHQTIQLIKQHMDAGHPIGIYGDYDVDGMCSTAILWEALYSLSKVVFPYIPHRRREGYGLSQIGIDACLAKGAKLIITVDNGIVAHEQISYARSQGADVIIIDHHEAGENLPDANFILHSTKTCAAALTWFFVREMKPPPSPLFYKEGELLNKESHAPTLKKEGLGEDLKKGLDLVSLAVVCDLVPLLGLNRSLVKYGLVQMRQTTRPGLLALFKEAGLDQSGLSTYHLGFIIGPRLNAMGRLEHALDSLRLLCTHDPSQAESLAAMLGETNRSRQQFTQEATAHAIAQIEHKYPNLLKIPKLLIVSDSSYDEGIIGLIASKLVEKYARPAIAVSVGEKIAKASARSVPGFHITEHLRAANHLLTAVGGHAMAAGFSTASDQLGQLEQFLIESANQIIDDSLLIRSRRVDAEIPTSLIGFDLYHRLMDFAPFGLGNPQPVFFTPQVRIEFPRRLGQNHQHLKFRAGNFDALAFNYSSDPPNPADLYYTLDTNTWNNQTKLQLIIKDIVDIVGTGRDLSDI